MKMFVIVRGSFQSGHNLTGPYDSKARANDVLDQMGDDCATGAEHGHVVEIFNYESPTVVLDTDDDDSPF